MIKLQNVTKKYGSFLAIDNASFEIKDGEIIGLLGPNGAGKTTIMNMITGFIEPTDGKITINDFDIIRKAKKAKKDIGYMPEGVPLYGDLTPYEFVTYMAELKLINKKDRKDAILKAIKATGIEDVKSQLIKSLSRGYKQRVSMAGALVGEPKILILDEPTVGLDPKQIIEIRELIKNLKGKHTVILSSHILSEVNQICEKVIIINKGKIIAIDNPKNLEEKNSPQNALIITVEDNENKINNLKDNLPNISEIKLLATNTDGSKQYEIISGSKDDFRKELSENLIKENISILEIKKEEKSLEDVFVKLITDENNNNEGGNENVDNN